MLNAGKSSLVLGLSLRALSLICRDGAK